MRFATEHDLQRLLAFLGQAGVSTENVDTLFSQFMIEEDEQGKMKVAIGYERAGEEALLRSLVLSQRMNPLDILEFLQIFLQRLQTRGITNVYVLAKHKDFPLFHMFGFQAVEKVPKQITDIPHFQRNIRNDCIVLNCQLFTKLSTIL